MKLSVDVDDFLSPGQECVKPVAPAQKKTLTLQDCLACSGCITSAEAMLVTAQSTTEFARRVKEIEQLRQLNAAEKSFLVVSIAPESRAALAEHWQCSVEVAQRKLRALFKGVFGARFVVDTHFAAQIFRLESRAEFAQHVQQCEKEGRVKPLLSSVCPGWICFAEKSHPEVLSSISRVRSPQQIAGLLVKKLLAAKFGVASRQIYHVAVMMCFDKKLEATRTDFAEGDLKHVDTVLATTEVLDLMTERGLSFADLDVERFGAHDNPFDDDDKALDLGYTEGSGALAADMFRFVAGKTSTDAVNFKAGRNTDIKEAATDAGVVVCVSNGFRNIQNIVRKIASPKGCPIHYVEVMACPGGCLNGGGQIRASSSDSSSASANREEAKKKLARVIELHTTAPLDQREFPTDALQRFYRDFVKGEPGSEQAKALFYTDYHELPKVESGLSIKW